MTTSATDNTNIVEFRHFAGNAAPKIPDPGYTNPALPQDSNDRYIADGLQLMRSFMLIEDTDMRTSIIRLVEKSSSKIAFLKSNLVIAARAPARKVPLAGSRL